MSSTGSVTFWIRQLKAGERGAMQKLWESYFQRLVGLVRAKIRGIPRQIADEEDVALSAFDSFFRAVDEGRFPKLDDRDDLWQILVLLGSRKAANLAKHVLARKRGHGRVKPMSVPSSGAASDESVLFVDLISQEPDPKLAAEVAEQCQRLLALLDDEVLRQIALWKLEAYSNDDIAGKIGRSVATVERKLKRIRECWEKELLADWNDPRKSGQNVSQAAKPGSRQP